MPMYDKNKMGRTYLSCGAKLKYTIIKNEKIASLPVGRRQLFLKLLEEMKQTPNEYLVINIDEPYIEEIVDILKKHGHWG